MMNKPHPFTLVYVTLAFLLLLLLQNFLAAEKIHPMPYSAFKQAVADGKVSDLVITPKVIRGIMKEPGGDGKVVEKPFVTVRVEDPELVRELEARQITFTGVVENPWLNTLLWWLVPIGLFFLLGRFLYHKVGPGQGMLSVGMGQNKAKIYAQGETGVTFTDVAGVDEAKEELQEIIEFLKHPKKFQTLGGRIPKGVLLVGPPGTGKTLLAKAVAGEAGVPFFSVSGSEFVEMFVGLGAARVRDLFQQAQQKAPCIIFIDELDALGKARGANPLGGHDEREQTLNQLLVELDGFDTRKGVVIMAATNRPEILDLANVMNEAALLAARRGKAHVTMAEMEEAIDRIVAGLEKKARVMSQKEREIVAYHESGHALVAASVPTADPVHKISIIPRGIAALGYTLQLPTQDRYLLTKDELLDRIAVMLGGRVAEELTFQQVSTGAQDDLKRATDIARRMVTEYGMSERLGLLTFEPERQSLFLGGPVLPSGRAYSEETAREIDQEVKRIIEEAHGRVRDLLTRKNGRLDRLAKQLLEREVLEGEALQHLLTTEPAEVLG